MKIIKKLKLKKIKLEENGNDEEIEKQLNYSFHKIMKVNKIFYHQFYYPKYFKRKKAPLVFFLF